MSDINLKSKELKNEEEFLKWFFKKYGSKVKKNKESIEWAKSLYNDTVNESLNQSLNWVKLDSDNTPSKDGHYLVTVKMPTKKKEVIPAIYNSRYNEWENFKYRHAIDAYILAWLPFPDPV